MNLASLINDAQYMRFVRKYRQQVRGLRRRGLLGVLYRAMQETDPQGKFTGVEVGVKFGTLSQQILESLPQVSHMVLVDPWKEFPQDHSDRGVFSYAKRSQHGWDRMAESCANRMKQFGDRAYIARCTSLAAAEEFLDYYEQAFFVYIDASHAYEDVLADCRAWWPLVQPGGILAGDDFQFRGHPNRTESVSEAVETFAAEIGEKIIGHHRNWMIQKPV